jgi:hypothetical protein
MLLFSGDGVANEDLTPDRHRNKTVLIRVGSLAIPSPPHQFVNHLTGDHKFYLVKFKIPPGMNPPSLVGIVEGGLGRVWLYPDPFGNIKLLRGKFTWIYQIEPAKSILDLELAAIFVGTKRIKISSAYGAIPRQGLPGPWHLCEFLHLG